MWRFITAARCRFSQIICVHHHFRSYVFIIVSLRYWKWPPHRRDKFGTPPRGRSASQNILQYIARISSFWAFLEFQNERRARKWVMFISFWKKSLFFEREKMGYLNRIKKKKLFWKAPEAKIVGNLIEIHVALCRVCRAYVDFLYCIFLFKKGVLSENQWFAEK